MILIVNNRSHFLPELQVRLHELGTAFELQRGERPISYLTLERYTGVILSGGPLLLDRALYLNELTADLTILMEAVVPVLGICLGHELIAETHGAEIVRLPALINREEKMVVLRENRLFHGLSGTIKVRMVHYDDVATLPDGFERLAATETCKYAAIKHAEKDLYSVQFHPEASGTVGRNMLRNFLHLCGEPARVPGLETTE